jgi:hypothetical protein
MSESDSRLAELTARIAVLEAAVRTGAGSVSVPATSDNDYPFVSKLTGEDLLNAQALVKEVGALRAQIDDLKGLIEQRDYRILHLTRSLEKYIPKP